ncbi:MAG TPA: response regulator transcription factor [Candidatus Baltobacteraceae bacterium]|nr:response regulator transcription factor [Candidatus Baltobacteraceae bacterium]
MRVMIVEDDTALRRLIVRGLQEDGHVADALPDGRECADYLIATCYDVAILDLNLPHRDGLAVLRELRERGIGTPVLLLTARVDARDVVDGLDAGADDYLRKPFALDELHARLRSLARRAPTWSDDLLRCDDLVFDRRSREARRGERPIDLTSKEVALLETLLRNAGRTVTREALIDAVWDRSTDPASNVLDVYARRLRMKLCAIGEPPLLHTVRGIGFKLGPTG